jgi:hypothetical protein
MKLFGRRPLLVIALFAFVRVSTALADDQATKPEGLKIVVYQLDQARDNLSPETGSSTYDFGQKAIQNLPEGDFIRLNDVILQAPKTGDFGDGGRTSLMGGSNDTLEANQEAYGTKEVRIII